MCSEEPQLICVDLDASQGVKEIAGSPISHGLSVEALRRNYQFRLNDRLEGRCVLLDEGQEIYIVVFVHCRGAEAAGYG